jgi:hypothetical protein
MMKHHLYDPSDAMEGDTRIKDPHRETGLADITLGMNILHRFHLYIAYKEKKLYITPATAPVPSAPVAPAVATTATTH